jgi:aminoglycoside phosphotransferase (APT) family kinase protein
MRDRGIDGRLGSEWILRRLSRGCRVDQLAQDTDHWQAVVNAVMNLRVPVLKS